MSENNTELEVTGDSEAVTGLSEKEKKQIAKKEKKQIAKKEKKQIDKAKKNDNNIMDKKKKKKNFILSVVGVLVVGLVVTSYIKSKQPMMVQVVECNTDSISENLNLSGTVVSLETKTIFAPVDGKIDSFNYSVGDYVTKGSSLYEYDKDDLSEQLKLAELKLQSAEGSYNDSIQKDNRNSYRNGEADLNLGVLEQQITDWDAYVKTLQKKISDKQDAIAQYGALLQISLLDWADRPDSDEYMNLQKQVQWNNYEASHNEEIAAWNRELEQAQTQLSEFKSYKSQMQSQENSTIDSAMTGGTKQQLQAELETAQIEAEDKSKALSEAEGGDGIQAEFNGIVTSVDTTEGASVAKGSKIMTLENIDDVAVKVKLTKYDLENISIGQEATITVNNHEYKGKVSKINSFAEKNDSGSTIVGAQISIDNPDQNLILGLEAKALVLIGEEDNALVVPNEVINYGTDGPFVMVVRDGVLVKQPIQVGLAGDFMTQVTEGLSEGDLVVKDSIEYLTEGVAVNAVVTE